MKSGAETFKRGQVEWAIWRFFTLLKSASDDPPKVFLTRIKRLLETDRHDKVPAGQDYPPPAPYAFSSAETEGQGVDAAFTSFDAFCLALALDLVDVGFKPSEIVFLLRYLRPDLQSQFQAILRAPPPPPRVSLPRMKGKAIDHRVFWVIQKIEVREIYPQKSPGPARSSKRAKPEMPLFLDIKFCRGAESLNEELSEMNQQRWGYRKALVLEIAYMAANLTELLPKAPSLRRGRN